MKSPRDVGADFDEYARRWRKEKYGLETGYDAHGVTIDRERSEQVQRPGDEWGDVAPLRDAYSDLLRTFGPPTGPVNVLEIGAGGGRSTAVMLDVLADRAGQYHAVDVAAGFVEVLKERVDFPVAVHIVDDVDLSALPSEHFDLCLAQSSWSHIGLYDQYRYLRELRRVLRPRAPIYVSGQFLLGVGNDWTWNRFRRRVDQIDRAITGVFHEFTSIAALAEMLTRLQYDIACINGAGFVARRGENLTDAGLASLPGSITVPFNASPHLFLATGQHEVLVLPGGTPVATAAEFVVESIEPNSSVTAVVPVRRPSPAPVANASGPAAVGPTTTIRQDASALVRRILKGIPGVRPFVIQLRRKLAPAQPRR